MGQLRHIGTECNTTMLTVKDCLVLVATLALTVSCQDQRLEIVPLFDGLTSTPGNQFTFQPQPAVPGLERETELTSPSPSLNLQAFKAVPIAAPPTATIPPAVPHPSLKDKLSLTTPQTTTSPPPPPSPPSPPTTTTPPPPPPSPPTALPTTTTPPPSPTTTAAPPAKTLSVFGSSLPAGRPQNLAELPRQRPQQQQQQQELELFQQQQRQQQQQQQRQQQQTSRFQTQFNQNPRQEFAPQPPRQRVVQQPGDQSRHPEEFLNRLTEEDKTKFLQQFSYLNLEQQQYAYNQFLSTPANVQQFAIKQFLSLDPEVLVFSIQTEIDSERGVQPQRQITQPLQPQFNQQQQQQQQQQQGQRFNNNNQQQPRQLSGADARALQQQENALNDIIALQNSLNFPNQS